MELFCILGFIFISLIGSLSHFFYDWSKQKKYVGFFVAVNESTWEHLKLGFFPTFIWAIIGLFFGFNNFAFGVFVALLTILIVIPLIFYSYTYFLKRYVLVIDILSFFIAIGLAMFFAYTIFNSFQFQKIFNIIGIIGIITFLIMYSTFTFFPPKNFLFKDPQSNKYGFEK